MTRDQRDEQIWLYASDASDGAEAESVRRLLAEGDPADAAAYAEAMATVSHLPMALDPVAPPKIARDRLLSRVAASQSSGRSNWVSWSLAALAAAASVVLAIRTMQLSVEVNRQQMALDQAQGALRGKDVQLVALGAGVQPPKAHGQIIWNKDANEWHVYVFDLTPPAPGRVMELWFITPDQKAIRGGEFMVDARGNGSMVTKVPPGLTQIALAAITDEPAGGVDVATGQIQLKGAVQ